MDVIIELIQLPFELLTNSVECLVGCIVLALLACCCINVVMLAFVVDNVGLGIF